MFLVTDPGGKVIASLGGTHRWRSRSSSTSCSRPPRDFPQQSSGFYSQNGELYHISVTPVYVDSTRGPALLNVLVAGYPAWTRWWRRS